MPSTMHDFCPILLPGPESVAGESVAATELDVTGSVVDSRALAGVSLGRTQHERRQQGKQLESI